MIRIRRRRAEPGTAGGHHEPEPPDTSPPEPDPQDFAAELRGLREDFDKLLPHVVTALKRNDAHAGLEARLDRAERRLEARRERPMAVAVHRLLCQLRHMDFDRDVKAALEHELVRIIGAAGFGEFGNVGDVYDPRIHKVLGDPPPDARDVVEVHATGLATHDDLVVRAQVRLGAISAPAFGKGE